MHPPLQPIPPCRDGFFVALTRCSVAAKRLIAACALACAASTADAQSPEDTLQRFEIRSVTFEGNELFTTGELAPLLRTKASPGFLNKFFYKSISERLGSPDEFYDPLVLWEDAERVRQFYMDHGFQDGRVDTALHFLSGASLVEVTLRITEGYRSVIDSLTLKGIVNAPGEVARAIYDEPGVARGYPFSKALMEEEVKRIVRVLRNAGYARALFQRESSSVTYRTSSRNYSVMLAFSMGQRYNFGDVSVRNELEETRPDINPEDVLHQLDYVPSEVFNEEKVRTSEKNLNRMGMFEGASIETRLPDTPESVDVQTVVRFRPRDKHEVAPELSFSDENNNFNLGTGIGYTNRNFLGGARTFTTRLRFRTQNFRAFPDVFNANNDAVANADLTFEILQPYLFSNKVKGTWSLSLIADKQALYITRILQNRFGVTDRFAEFTMGFFDWTLQRVQLERKESVGADTTNPEVRLQLQELAAQQREVQFNSILAFTIQRDLTNDIFSPSRGLIHSLTLEESGLLALAIRGWQPDLPFTQFYRVSSLLRWYFDLTGDTRYNIVALKLKGGFEDKWGESTSDTSRSIPQTHRFYAGGGGSVRGWRSRELSATGSAQFGGNILFEGSVELRTNILQSLKDDALDKLWTVLFIDAGNVWADVGDLQIAGIAVAAGVGLRYETFFGPFRIDYGLQVYDPAGRTNGKKWITERKLWSETFRSGVLHFGIGHSF